MDLRQDGTPYMKKRSGIGGTGGRELSPELRVRFGTYGFKKDQVSDRRMLNLDDKLSNSNTIQVFLSSNRQQRLNRNHG